MRAFLTALAGAAFVALATAPTAGHAEQAGLYFGADVGLVDFDMPGRASEFEGCNDDDCSRIGSPSVDGTNFRVSGVIGTGVVEQLRAEAEVFFDIDTVSGSENEEQGVSASVSADVRTYGVMLNSWFDIGIDTAWAVYLGGGAGMLFAETSHEIVDRAGDTLRGGGEESDAEFAYQIGLGVHIQGWHVGYRYLSTGDLNDFGEISQHVLMIGLRMW